MENDSILKAWTNSWDVYFMKVTHADIKNSSWSYWLGCGGLLTQYLVSASSQHEILQRKV